MAEKLEQWILKALRKIGATHIELVPDRKHWLIRWRIRGRRPQYFASRSTSDFRAVRNAIADVYRLSGVRKHGDRRRAQPAGQSLQTRCTGTKRQPEASFPDSLTPGQDRFYSQLAKLRDKLQTPKTGTTQHAESLGDGSPQRSAGRRRVLAPWLGIGRRNGKPH